MGLPWQQLGIGFGLSLLLSSIGFKRVVYFVSLGYAASIAAQAVVMPVLYRDTLGGWVLLQSGLLLAYGVRLGSFVALRERSPTYRKELAENAARGAPIKGVTKGAIWVSVSLLYVVMFTPALLTMQAQAQGSALPSLLPGMALMAVGLGVEAWADHQKSRFKAKSPSRFCDVGLYRVVRCPNYLGEVLFWLGTWLSGVSAYQTPLAWALSALGLVCISLIMLGSTRRLELKQDERYGTDSEYQRYARTVPVLIPLVPLYSLRKLKVYLG